MKSVTGIQSVHATIRKQFPGRMQSAGLERRDRLGIECRVGIACHLARQLRRQLCQFEGACSDVNPVLIISHSWSRSHARMVTMEPAVAPDKPKQRMVERHGPRLAAFAMSRGFSPVILSMDSAYLYLAAWYIVKDAVRTAVTLNKGGRTPG